MIKLLGFLLLLPLASVVAEQQEAITKDENNITVRVNPLVYDRTVKGSMDEVYKHIFTGLENNSYYVIF